MAVLECSVKARYRPMILWYQDFQPLTLINGKHVHTYDGDLVQLTIRNVESRDVGTYECVARNTCGKSSSSCRLVVKGNLMTAAILFCEMQRFRSVDFLTQILYALHGCKLKVAQLIVFDIDITYSVNKVSKMSLCHINAKFVQL